MSKRKRYKPRGINPMAHLTAIMGSRILSKDDVTAMASKPRLALSEISKGKLTTENWQDLFDGCNLLEQLIRNGKARDPDGLITATQQAIIDIADRHKTTGSTALKAGELNALLDFCAAYTQVLETVTNQEVFEAFDAMQRRVARVMAEGKRTPGGIRVE